MNVPRGRDGGPQTAPTGSGDLRRRLTALVAAVLLGAAIGWAVERQAGTSWGYVAIPLLLVIGWWRHADPTRCVGPGDSRR